jgi:hypothetical protein
MLTVVLCQRAACRADATYLVDATVVRRARPACGAHSRTELSPLRSAGRFPSRSSSGRPSVSSSSLTTGRRSTAGSASAKGRGAGRQVGDRFNAPELPQCDRSIEVDSQAAARAYHMHGRAETAITVASGEPPQALKESRFPSAKR